MTDYVQTGFNTPISASLALASNDTLFISKDASIILPAAGTTLGSATNADNNRFTIYGQVDVGGFKVGAFSTFYLGATGQLTLHGAASALALGSLSVALNAGTIFGADVYGVIMNGGSANLVNTGTIYGSEHGVTMGYGAVSGDTVENHGTILSDVYEAVTMVGGAEHLINYGTISSRSGEGVFVMGEVNGFATSQRIDNSGVIQASANAGIQTLLTNATSALLLYNSGIIRGVNTAFQGGGEIDNIYNSGRMEGLVQLAGGNDLFDCTGGTVTLYVDLGTGADTFLGMGAHVLSVAGGTGSDTYTTDDANLKISEDLFLADTDTVNAAVSYRMNAGIEVLNLLGTADYSGFGNETANTITGNAGDNRLTGQDGNDTVSGDLGDDRVTGGTGSDSLNGNDGADVLQGNLANDTLRGGEGDDSLTGGLGKDMLTGDTGADIFVFGALNQSDASQANADIIADFVQGDDLIDLHAIDAIRNNAASNNAFTFIDTGAFNLNTPGQLRYLTNAGKTYIEMDVNGDQIADCVIRLNGVITLNAGDFVL